MKRPAIAFLAIMLVTFAAHADELSPFTAAAQTKNLEDQEARVWFGAGEFDRALRLRGHLFGDAELDSYLQQLIDELYPEMADVLRVRAVRDSTLNAFALPNGSLYINIGLIGRLENEAQLATVLAHECAHFIFRHGFRTQQNLKSSSALAVGAAMLGAIPALLGGLAAVSSIYGYSRDLEREADVRGFAQLTKAGYALSESTKAFELLEAEAKLLEIKEPFMFSSHPKLRERIETFAELSANSQATGVRIEVDRFLQRTSRARQAWLDAELERQEPKSLIYHLTRSGASDRFPPSYHYYLGEAYRLRAQQGDTELAQAEYARAIAAAPQFAPAHRALGLLLMRRGDNDAAREHFSEFLRIAPNAREAGYVRDYLQRIQQQAKGDAS